MDHNTCGRRITTLSEIFRPYLACLYIVGKGLRSDIIGSLDHVVHACAHVFEKLFHAFVDVTELGELTRHVLRVTVLLLHRFQQFLRRDRYLVAPYARRIVNSVRYGPV